MKKNKAMLKFSKWGIWALSILITTNLFAKENSIFTEAKQIRYQPIILKPCHPPSYLQAGNLPNLERAYERYLQTGRAPNIITEGFVQFAYGAQQPIVPASPFELSVISLEPGEEVTNVSSGDPMRWSFSLAYSGNPIRQAHIMIKPSFPNISTDMVITTDKRFYTLKLMSRQNGHYYRDVRFWYPADMQKVIDTEIKEKAEKLERGDSPFQEKNQLDVNHLNFNYRIQCPFFGCSPRWYPARVFDDGHQTYIQFPHTLEQIDLPALFVQSNKQMLIANFRVKAPYFIVDRIFERAVLVSGTGKNQQTITLINQAIMG